MGRFDPYRLSSAWVALAWNPTGERAEAFLTWVPIWARRGWALDLLRRRPDAVPGATEFLVAKSVEAARARGDALLSLSLSALVAAERPVEDLRALESDPGTPALGPGGERARELLLRHLSRFYDFESLFHWKKKFDPEFEPRYLVYPSPAALPRVAFALARAQSPGGFVSYFRPSRAAGG
jgi:phosphatidylglycerol lysyltransferase